MTFGTLLGLAGMQLPDMAEIMLPFCVLFTAIYTCWKLNKTHELVVIRAAGVSVWQFLSPMLFCAVMTGVFSTSVLNPVASTMLAKFNQALAGALQQNNNLVTVSRTGIWLRQSTSGSGGLRAAARGRFRPETMAAVRGFRVLFRRAGRIFLRRIGFAPGLSARRLLGPAGSDGQRAQSARRKGRRSLRTELTSQKIEESFADPEYRRLLEHPRVSPRILWKKPASTTTPLMIHFHRAAGQPLLFHGPDPAGCALFFATPAKIRRHRRHGLSWASLLDSLYSSWNQCFHAFGISQKIPATLAAWTPAVVSLLLGMTALLHLEDG